MPHTINLILSLSKDAHAGLPSQMRLPCRTPVLNFSGLGRMFASGPGRQRPIRNVTRETAK